VEHINIFVFLLENTFADHSFTYWQTITNIRN